MSVKVPDAVKAALADLRKDGAGPATRYLVVGYSDKVTLEVVGTGEGDFNAAAKHLTDDKQSYVLVRFPLKVEMASTVKFAYVDWTPETMKPMRKALLSTHKGQVEDLMKPFHVSVQVSERGELDSVDGDISKRIGRSTGTANYVVDRTAMLKQEKWASERSERLQKQSDKAKASVVPNSVRAERGLEFEDEEEFKEAIAAVRNDSDATDWMLASYEDDSMKHITVIGKGEGGVEELASKLDSEKCYYALFRVTEKIDKSVTVKFGLLRLLSDSLKPMKRALVGTHSGFVTRVFAPFHTEFNLSSVEDFSFASVMDKISSYSGTKSHVVEAGHGSEVKSMVRGVGASTGQKAQAKAGWAVPKDSSSAPEVQMDDDEEFAEAFAAVRSDSDATTWMIAAYVDKRTLGDVVKGEGGAAEMCAAFKSKGDAPCYGLLRVTDKIDNSVTVKFVYVKWMPAGVKAMTRGQLNTIVGSIDKLFSPKHVEIFAAGEDELTADIVNDLVTATSGSKSMVRKKE